MLCEWNVVEVLNSYLWIRKSERNNKGTKRLKTQINCHPFPLPFTPHFLFISDSNNWEMRFSSKLKKELKTNFAEHFEQWNSWLSIIKKCSTAFTSFHLLAPIMFHWKRLEILYSLRCFQSSAAFIVTAVCHTYTFLLACRSINLKKIWKSLKFFLLIRYDDIYSRFLWFPTSAACDESE